MDDIAESVSRSNKAAQLRNRLLVQEITQLKEQNTALQAALENLNSEANENAYAWGIEKEKLVLRVRELEEREGALQAALEASEWRGSDHHKLELEARKRVKKLEQEGKRLDWLERQVSVGDVCSHLDWDFNAADTLRRAIDKARG